MEDETAGRISSLIRVRWFAAAIPIGIAALDTILGEIGFPVMELLYLGVIILAANTASLCFLRRLAGKRKACPPDRFLSLISSQVILDWLVLVSFIMLTGGLQSPFKFLFTFGIILTGLLLRPIHVYLVASIAFLVMFCLSILQGMDLFSKFQKISYVDSALFADVGHVLLGLTETAILMFVPAFLVTLFSRRMLNSEARQLELRNRLQHNLDELERQEKERRDYRRTITHELRAPITASMSMIALLAGEFAGEMNSKQKEMLEKAGNRLSGALEILQDILVLEASQKPRKEADLEDVELTYLFDEVLGEVTEQIKQRGIILDYVAPPRGLCVNAILEDLIRIFRNLIGNAIKYNKDGGTISLVCCPENTTVRIEVCDTGIGILSNETERVFQEFFRASNARSISNIGTGLGLCIVKSLVEKYGGRIEVRSELSEGTTFSVTLPISSENRRTIGQERKTSP